VQISARKSPPAALRGMIPPLPMACIAMANKAMANSQAGE
jgi:hypothetical protein